jgi:pyruvate,water dikinase
MQHLEKEICSGVFPEKLRLRIKESINFRGPFAIRSSAITEDLKDISSAGIYDSILNVEEYNILENIIRCFSAYFGMRAIKYRSEKGVTHSAGMAFFIQEMIYPQFSGVLFTKDPQNPNNMVLELTTRSWRQIDVRYYKSSNDFNKQR